MEKYSQFRDRGEISNSSEFEERRVLTFYSHGHRPFPPGHDTSLRSRLRLAYIHLPIPPSLLLHLRPLVLYLSPSPADPSGRTKGSTMGTDGYSRHMVG